MAIVCLAHLLITKHQPNRNIPQFYIEKQWNLNCSTIGPHLEIQIGRRRRVQTNQKNDKLPVATRFLGSFDGNGGVYDAPFKKPAGDSEKKTLFTEPKPCKPETIRWQPWQNWSSRTHKYLDLAVVPGYCLVEQPGAQQIGTGNWGSRMLNIWKIKIISSQMWHSSFTSAVGTTNLEDGCCPPIDSASVFRDPGTQMAGIFVHHGVFF